MEREREKANNTGDVYVQNRQSAHAQFLNIDRIHPDHRPMVAAPFQPTHTPVVQGSIAKTHDVALARAW